MTSANYLTSLTAHDQGGPKLEPCVTLKVT